MHRFRLLGLYVAGLVAAIGLAIGGLAVGRADGQGAREASAAETATPTAVNAGSICLTAEERQASSLPARRRPKG